MVVRSAAIRWVMSVLVAASAVAHVASTAAADDRVPLKLSDLYEVTSAAAAVSTPDERRVIFSRQWIDKATSQERFSLWSGAGAEMPAKALEPGEPDARLPIISPDGRWVVIRSTRPRPDGWRQTPPVPAASEPATDIWFVPIDGGTAIPLAGPEKPYGRVFIDPFYARVAFSPDGRQLAFVADDGVDPRTAQELEANVEIVRPDQGEGYTGYRPAQIWVADLPDLAKPGAAPQPTPASASTTPTAPTASSPLPSPLPSHMATRIRRISPDDAWYGDPQWSRDGKSIVVHANRTDDRESVRFSINKNYDLWLLDVAAASPPRQLTSGPGPEVSPRWSPDGRRLACLSSPRKGPHADVFNLAIVDASAPTPRMNVVHDHHAVAKSEERGEEPGAEKRPYPQFPLTDDCWLSNEQLFFTAPLGLTSGQFVATVGAGTNSASKSAAVERLPADSRPLQRAAATNRLLPRMPSVLAQRRLGTTVRVEWKSNDGLAIDGLLTTPPEGVASAPHKLVVFPHGGPHSRATQGFNFTVELFAAHGYAVFQPNFRGSQGYGRKFLDADRNDFGGGDMRDILSGIEHLVETKQVDPKRQYVYGVSYGGYMTTWLVGQTTQFRAAVAQNAVTDLTMMWSLSDLQSWTEWEFGGRPWEQPEAMRKHSPLTYVDKIKTPTLLLHSRDDRRCPLPMGRAFHQSLLKAGVPTQLVIYPDEGHGIKQPKHREDVLRRTLAWFAEHP